MSGGAAPTRRIPIPNWAVAGLLTVFVGSTYFQTFRRVSIDDLDAELEREIEQEIKRQERK